jgi:pyruvate ferredoxin oxidoreductase beta subunit
MEKYNIYSAKLLPKHEILSSGHRACQGCGELLAVRQVCKAIGPDLIIANATGCLEIVTSSFPDTAWTVPWIHVAFENAAAVASGIESAIKVLKRKGRYPNDRDIKIVAFAGDGGTADIGMQALSGALERYHNFMYVCYDNEAYMNTGIQRSSSTPYCATTTTSPSGKKSKGQKTNKKNLPEIAAAHNIPYVATACPSYPFDLMKKARKGVDIEGPAYLHIFSPCPTGWRTLPDDTVKLGRLAVESGVFPLYEVEYGNYKLTYKPEELIPVSQYLKGQGRYRHLSEDDINVIQGLVNDNYDKLLKKCEI